MFKCGSHKRNTFKVIISQRDFKDHLAQPYLNILYIRKNYFLKWV